MPRLVVTQKALEDLIRLCAFLSAKSPEASERAKQKILQSLRALPLFPEAHRPVHDLPYHRELVIQFGASGYVARYRYEPGGDVVVLRVRHQKEGNFI
jgi:plasmid stabilization system protein ParE